MEFISAEHLDYPALAHAFNSAYEDYVLPVNLNAAQMQAHIEHYDIRLDASRVLVEDGDIIGVGLLGIREKRGWVGGFGIAKARRRSGLGRQLMAALLDSAREAGLSAVQLEVIEGNSAAHSLYVKVGFQDLRRLLIFQSTSLTALSGSYEYKLVTLTEALTLHERFHPVPNPWQREPESLRVSGASAWAASRDGEPLAYATGITNQQSINLLDAGFTNEDALRGLVLHLHQQHPKAVGRFVNVGEDEPIRGVFESLGYQQIMSQFEMRIML
jgi:ribosomal protein S18 acetylase RimI-like enzyme